MRVRSRPIYRRRSLAPLAVDVVVVAVCAVRRAVADADDVFERVGGLRFDRIYGQPHARAFIEGERLVELEHAVLVGGIDDDWHGASPVRTIGAVTIVYPPSRRMRCPLREGMFGSRARFAPDVHRS